MSDTITIDEMKALIKEEKIKPSRLFGIDVLADDPVVKGITKEAVQAELTHRKRLSTRFEEVDEEREKEKTEWEKQVKEKDEEIKKLKIEGAKVKAVDLFNSKIKERKLDDQQKKFIEARRKDFSPENLDDLDRDVDKFMDASLEEYKETAKIFGHKTDKGGEPKGGGEPGDETDEEGDTSFIPD